MNRVDHIFTGMSLNVLDLFFGRSLIVLMISVSLNSRKVNISLLLCFLIFLEEWFSNCLNKCFRDFFFRAGDFFLNLRVFVKFVKEVFVQSMSYFLIVFDYSVIFVEDDCVSGHQRFIFVCGAERIISTVLMKQEIFLINEWRFV